MKNAPANPSPEAFEREVHSLLDQLGQDLTSFESKHREPVPGSDGVYEIDITARFQALGANLLVLIECKKHTSSVKRDAVQVLHDRIRSCGAHKGMLFATAGFQRGAIEYAKKHGIALVEFVDGRTTYVTKMLTSNIAQPILPPPWANVPAYVGWLITLNDDGNEARSRLDRFRVGELDAFLFGRPQHDS